MQLMHYCNHFLFLIPQKHLQSYPPKSVLFFPLPSVEGLFHNPNTTTAAVSTRPVKSDSTQSHLFFLSLLPVIHSAHRPLIHSTNTSGMLVMCKALL